MTSDPYVARERAKLYANEEARVAPRLFFIFRADNVTLAGRGEWLASALTRLAMRLSLNKATG